MNNFIFVRHAQSQANADRIIALEDAPLSAIGRAQARATAHQLQHYTIDHIICSPLLRAHQTAEIIAEATSTPLEKITILPELRERDFGPLKGHRKEHDSLWYISAEAAGVEPREKVYERMQRCLQTLRSYSGTTLVVGHAVAGFYLLQATKDYPSIAQLDPPFQLENAQFQMFS